MRIQWTNCIKTKNSNIWYDTLYTTEESTLPPYNDSITVPIASRGSTLPSPPLRNSSFRNGCINRRPESRPRTRPQWILIISGHVHTMCTPIFIPKSLEGFYEETIQCSENGDYSAWGGLWDAYWGRPQADPERSSRQVGRRRCKDDVDIGRSARGLKLCPGQSFVTMAHWARDLTPRDPTNTPRRHVITLSISY